MGKVTRKPFDTAAFLPAEGPSRSIRNYTAKQILFSQRGPADAVFYLQTGRAKLTVLSQGGKEATVTLLAAGDFFGEESMAGAGTLRTVTALAITACTALKIARAEILRVTPSCVERAHHLLTAVGRRRAGQPEWVRTPDSREVCRQISQPVPPFASPAIPRSDRKSTRLNSSH